MADAAGNVTGVYDKSDIAVRQFGGLIAVVIQGTSLYYAPAKFLNDQGINWGTTVNAALNAYNLSIPSLGGGTGGGTATTDASQLTTGTLSEARLPNTAVRTSQTYASPSWLTALDASKVTQSSSARFATDAEKTGWNSKQDATQVANAISNATLTIANKTAPVSGIPAPNLTSIQAWGDSHTAGAGQTPWTTTLATLCSCTVVNQGVGGETSTQIKARFDASSTAQKQQMQIIWAGFNDYLGDNTYVAAKSNIAAMVAALGHDSYLIIGEIMSKNGGYESGLAGWINRKAFNDYLSTTYGDHFVDIHSVLTAAYSTTSATDVQDYINDVEPASLLIDAQHFTSAANANIIAPAIYKQMGRLNFTKTVSVSPTGIAKSLSNATPIGVGVKDVGNFSYLYADRLSLSANGTLNQEGRPILYSNGNTKVVAVGLTAGKLSLASTQADVQSTYIGYQAGANTIPAQYQANSFIGTNSGYANTTGARNTFIGSVSGFSNTLGNNNVHIGWSAGQIADGYNNTFIGYQAGDNVTSGGLDIIIGSQRDAASATANGNIDIGGLFIGTGATATGTAFAGNAGIGIAPDGTNKLRVGGSTLSTQYRLSALNTAPTSATDTGTLGEIRITAGFIYVCTATNTWVRSALATW